MFRVAFFPRQFQFLALFLAFAGCGSGKPAASVSGSVKYAGEVISAGSIRLDPVDAKGGKAVGTQIKDGKYEISLDAGLVEGEYLVAILGTRETGKSIAPAERLHGTPSTPIKETEQFIPEKYNANSKLKISLKAGANLNQDFNLELGEKPASSDPTTPGTPN